MESYSEEEESSTFSEIMSPFLLKEDVSVRWKWKRKRTNCLQLEEVIKNQLKFPIIKYYIVLVLILGTQLVLRECDAYRIHKRAETPLSVDTYSPVFYSPSDLLFRHSSRRNKRDLETLKSPSSSEDLHLSLTTESRDFHISLQEEADLFHPNALIENDSGDVLNYKRDHIFKGFLRDDPGSKVDGIITKEGFFDGVISTGEGQVFHIEPSERFVKSNLTESLYFLVTPLSYHGSKYSETSCKTPGIIYEAESVQWPSDPKVPCASDLLHQNQKKGEEASTSAFNFPSPKDPKVLKRSKRFIIDPRKRTCMLYLQADHLFYTHFGSEEKAINMMVRHIQRINEIYRGTDFDGDGSPDGISFMIKRIKVHSNANSSSQFDGDFQVIKFLERFSEGDYESFCLAYMFTFRDFEGGTLGLAWTGDLKNAGGVCERKGHFRGGLKSLNTGIITLLNYGKVVLPAVSYVTLAHEIGHNFGSPHDPESDKECVPAGRDGNFIMFARATAGDQRNNQRFSPCSLRSIQPVLNYKARNIHGCFSEPQSGICGNREVEEGEECDCGWEEDCVESCCWPMKLKYERGQVPCTLKPRKECSPSQGPCCTQECELRGATKCREDNGCRHTAFCDGLKPQCPPSVHKPNKTVCLEGQNVCFMGECTGSICLAYGMESCQCPENYKSCELCCKHPGEGPCLSSFELNAQPFDVPDLYAKPGSPCKNYTGYCDAYRSCREVDPSGPLATLRNLLLADEGLSAIAHWIDTHWYAVVSFVALLIVMMVLTAKLCGKQATKKLRKITILHSNVDAIQVERSYWDEGGEHVVHATAVRKKIPLRKKIREKKNRNGQRNGGAGGNGQRSQEQGSSKENRPRYGTLWRKRKGQGQGQGQSFTSRAAASSSSSPQKTEPEQAIDLVQLHTPPIMPAPATQSQSQSAKPSTSMSTSTPTSTPTAVASTSKSATIQYEAKTAILPNKPGAKSKGKKNGQKRRPSSSQGPSTAISSKGKRVRPADDPSPRSGPGQGPGRKGPSASSPKRRPIKKEEEKKPKKSFQIVYTPPFSVKVLTVELDPNGSSNGNSNSQSGSTAAVAATSTSTSTHQPKSAKPLSPIFEMPLPPIPITQQEEQEQGPPPYQEPASANNKKKPSSSSASATTSGGKGKVVRSSSSLLKRGKKRGKGKGELRVLIPPPNLDDDHNATPTPGT